MSLFVTNIIVIIISQTMLKSKIKNKLVAIVIVKIRGAEPPFLYI